MKKLGAAKRGPRPKQVCLCGVKFDSARKAAAELDVSEVYIRGYLAVAKAVAEYREKRDDLY